MAVIAAMVVVVAVIIVMTIIVMVAVIIMMTIIVVMTIIIVATIIMTPVVVMSAIVIVPAVIVVSVIVVAGLEQLAARDDGRQVGADSRHCGLGLCGPRLRRRQTDQFGPGAQRQDGEHVEEMLHRHVSSLLRPLRRCEAMIILLPQS
jgi:hypothetical protein